MPEGGRRIGRAMSAALAHGDPDAGLDLEGPSLANARRRQVFRYLCMRPCARVGEIGRVLVLSHATVRWHERNLLETGYLEVDGALAFPSGLIDPADAELFHLLTTPARDAVLRACVDDPGVSFQEIGVRVGLTRQSASKIAAELSDAGLVALVEDGRYRRMYPSDALEAKRERNRARIAAFVDRFLRRLADDGLSPELLRRDEATLLVRLGAGPHWVVFDVPLDPYLTGWAPPA